MRDYPPDPRMYELMTVLSPDVADEEITVVLDRIAGYVADAGGTVSETLRDSPWGRRRLAYPIRHASRDVRDGYYTVYHFQLLPARVEDVERELKLTTQVIRYLLTHYEPKPLDPRAIEDAEIDAEDAAAAAYAASQTRPPTQTRTPRTARDARPAAIAPDADAPVDVEAARSDEVAAPSNEEITTEEPRHGGNGDETVDEGPGGARHDGNGTETVEEGPGGAEEHEPRDTGETEPSSKTDEA